MENMPSDFQASICNRKQASISCSQDSGYGQTLVEYYLCYKSLHFWLLGQLFFLCLGEPRIQCTVYITEH